MKKLLIYILLLSKVCTGQHHAIGVLNLPTAAWAQNCPAYPALKTLYPINKFVQSEIADSNFYLLDRIWIFAVDTTSSAITSIANPSSTKITMVNSPTFNAYQGFTFNGSTSCLNSNYNPRTNSVNFGVTSNSFGLWYKTYQTVGNYAIGSGDGTTYSVMYYEQTGFNIYNNNVTASGIGAISNVLPKLAVTGNLNSTTVYAVENDTVRTVPAPAINTPNQIMYIGCYNNGSLGGFVDCQFSLAFMGGAINQITFYKDIKKLSKESGGW